MVFGKIRESLIKRQIAKEHSNALKQQQNLQKEVDEQKKQQKLTQKLLSQRATIINEQNKLSAQLVKAKKIKLTPAQRAILIAKQKRIDNAKAVFSKSASKVGSSIGRAGLGFLKGAGKLVAEYMEFEEQQKKAKSKQKPKTKTKKAKKKSKR